jgi:hypothetical protein
MRKSVSLEYGIARQTNARQVLNALNDIHQPAPIPNMVLKLIVFIAGLETGLRLALVNV